MFKVAKRDVWLWTLTFRVLLLRKSRIQLHIEVLSPRECSLFVRIRGMMLLKAKLKSSNSIRAYVFLFSRWDRTRWVAHAMASSVDLFSW